MIHDHCSIAVKLARQEAQEKGVKLPKVTTSNLGQDEYAVYIGPKYFEANGCCSADAKQTGIHEYIDEAEAGH